MNLIGVVDLQLIYDTAKEKIEEQLGKITKVKLDPKNRLTNKI